MPYPIIGLVAGHALRQAFTASNAKLFAGTFAQSLPYGIGYSLGTYVGFPKNYADTTSKKTRVYNLSMPYYPRRYYGRSYRRYPRYPRRYYGRRSYYGRRY